MGLGNGAGKMSFYLDARTYLNKITRKSGEGSITLALEGSSDATVGVVW